jgi:hypothetical protein
MTLIIFAYFGPETTLPIASTLAVITGFILATGRALTGWFTWKLRAQGRK